MQQFSWRNSRRKFKYGSQYGRTDKKFAYVTKSKPGIMDPDFGLTNAFMVPKQKVLQKVPLNQIDYGNVSGSYFEGRGTSKAELDMIKQKNPLQKLF
jgi:hypothetical protein